MPTHDRPDRRTLSILLAAGLLLAGCAAEPAPTSTTAPSTEPAAASERPDDLAPRLTRALRQRAAAVLQRDRTAFDAGLGGDAAFAQAQGWYWDNLAQLPLTGFDYRPDLRTVQRRGTRIDLVVNLRTTMSGFDAGPALSRWSMSFRDTPDGLRLVGASPGTSADSGNAQPWDLGPVEVRQEGQVLLVLAPGSQAQASDLMAAVRAGAADVAVRVPRGWNGYAVAYAPQTLRFMDTLAHVPGGDPSGVDALTFTVPGERPDSPAGLRIVLNPAWLTSPGPDRDRLLRHELTHVAMGPLGESVPAWVAEGVAEYVSVQSVPEAQRGLAGGAIDAAAAGFDSLPSDDGFDGNRSAANYGIAWWACEAIARQWGEASLWSLLDAYDRADTPDGVLLSVLGVGEPRLARDTARLMQQQYAVAR